MRTNSKVLFVLLLTLFHALALGRVQNDRFGLSTPDSGAAILDRLILEPTAGQLLAGYRITIKHPVSPFYLTQLVSSIEEPVKVGDVLRVRFWARAMTLGGHSARITIEMSQPPYEAEAEDMPTFGPEWKKYEIIGTSRHAYPVGGSSAHIQVGSKAGVVELADISVMNLGPDPEIAKAKLALTPHAIEQRIRQYRMADLSIKVVDSKGHPVRGATVIVNQVQHEFLFGCNIFGLTPNEKSNAVQLKYQERFAGLFNYATFPFYWGAFESTENHPDYERLEAMADWCRAQGITCKGHPLTYHLVYPNWAPKDESVVPTLKKRIEDIVRRYSAKIQYYDVFNEIHDAVSTDTGIGAWVRKVGKEHALEQALDWARQADPKAPHTFLYNDYQTSRSTIELLENLQHDGKLPDAIGIQSHMHNGTWPQETIWTTADRFARFGKPIHFTETTVLSGPKRSDVDDAHPPTDWISTPDVERSQADYVEQFYTILFSHPSVLAITWWDLSDLNAWRSAPAGLLRKDMSPKPAYERLMGLIHGKWWTKADGVTDSHGQFKVRSFRGTIRVSIKFGKSLQAVRTIKLTGSGSDLVVRI